MLGRVSVVELIGIVKYLKYLTVSSEDVKWINWLLRNATERRIHAFSKKLTWKDY